MTSGLIEAGGVRIAVEGCGHGTLDAIYASVARSCKERGWAGVDAVLIGGDFQAARNAADLTVMSVPAKFRAMGDFHAYYSGARTAPYLTVFVAGNHEAAAHLWELFYGGWAAPRIYYWGAANVLRLGPLRLAGLSGIWKGFDYRRPHHERLPFNQNDVRSFYHVREIDTRRLLQVREPVDIGLSHDWPRGIERHGDHARLFRQKPMFRSESEEGSLGSVAAQHVMDRLRPRYWFSAHLHCKYAAIKQYKPPSGSGEEGGGGEQEDAVESSSRTAAVEAKHLAAEEVSQAAASADGPSSVPAASVDASVDNPDEIDLDDDDDATATDAAAVAVADSSHHGESAGKQAEDESKAAEPEPSGVSGVSSELLAQLPASFLRPQQNDQSHSHGHRQPQQQPGQPVPPTITNTTVRFLALDKCLPGRHYLQLCEIPPASAEAAAAHPPLAAPTERTKQTKYAEPKPHADRFRLEYDPEWLAITRVFARELVIGGGAASPPTPPDLGEAHYRPLIDAERCWVDEHIVRKGLLAVPENFVRTAPVHTPVPGRPDTYASGQPKEYTNPQTAAFCELVGVPNLWDAPEEEREERQLQGPAPSSERTFNQQRGGGGGGGSSSRGRGGYRGGGGQFRGRGRGRGRGW